MSSIDRIVDEIIRKAMEAGEFNHLAGFGKPIEWNDNPFTPGEWRMVEDLLKKNDLAYPWMEKRKEIERLIEELKVNIRRLIPLSSDIEVQIIEEIKAINRKIIDYNLSVPVMRLQRQTVNIENLLKSIAEE